MLLCAAGAGPFGNTASRRFCTKAHGFPDAKGGIKMAPKAPTSPAQRYYITPEGGSPQPVREASAGPGQNPWRPGPKARRRHQPSRRSRVNLREYRKAPLRSRSQSRPRHDVTSPYFFSTVSVWPLVTIFPSLRRVWTVESAVMVQVAPFSMVRSAPASLSCPWSFVS